MLCLNTVADVYASTFGRLFLYAVAYFSPHMKGQMLLPYVMADVIAIYEYLWHLQQYSGITSALLLYGLTSAIKNMSIYVSKITGHTNTHTPSWVVIIRKTFSSDQKKP